MSGGVRPFGGPEVWAPTGRESADIDRRAIEDLGVPQPALMENAGRAVASVVTRLFPRGEVVALVGSGNNGGDALVCLRTLASWGRPVRAVRVGRRPESDAVLHGWPIESVSGEDDVLRILASAAVVLDGILGIGIRGAPREPQADAIRRLNASGRPVIALDVPSGVDADTGAVPGEAVTADVTIAFGWPKLGLLLHPARGRVGRLLAFEIGFPPLDASYASGHVLTPGWATRHRPRRRAVTHKNDVGSLLVVAGSEGMAGAAALAGRSALRAGAGLVRIASVDANRTVLQGSVPEAVFVRATDPSALAEAIQASAALVVGPGLGTSGEAELILESLLAGPARPTLFDADALNLLAAGRPCALSEAIHGRPSVVTPHPGEMSRLTGGNAPEMASDRAGFARGWSAENNTVLLLKGTPSLVAAPGSPLLVDAVGTSDLATGGMGDVLSGVVGAFLAQGVDPRTAAGLGLHTSGRAAVRSRRAAGLLPTDVVDLLPSALEEDGPGDSDLDLPGLVFDQDPAR